MSDPYNEPEKMTEHTRQARNGVFGCLGFILLLVLVMFLFPVQFAKFFGEYDEAPVVDAKREMTTACLLYGPIQRALFEREVLPPNIIYDGPRHTKDAPFGFTISAVAQPQDSIWTCDAGDAKNDPDGRVTGFIEVTGPKGENDRVFFYRTGEQYQLLGDGWFATYTAKAQEVLIQPAVNEGSARSYNPTMD